MNNLKTPARQRMKNSALAAIAGLSGCVTVVIVITALFLGLWFDSLFNWQGPCTIGVLILSMPVSLYVMLRITLWSINRLQHQPENQDVGIKPQQ